VHVPRIALEKGGLPRITASSAPQQGRSAAGHDFAVPGWVFRCNFEQSDSVWGRIALFNPPDSFLLPAVFSA
jgi:hypothetical protein